MSTGDVDWLEYFQKWYTPILPADNQFQQWISPKATTRPFVDKKLISFPDIYYEIGIVNSNGRLSLYDIYKSKRAVKLVLSRNKKKWRQWRSENPINMGPEPYIRVNEINRNSGLIKMAWQGKITDYDKKKF